MGRNLSINADEELNQKFHEMFAEKKELTEHPLSPLCEKLINMKVYHFMDEFSHSSELSKIKKQKPFAVESRKTIYQAKLNYYCSDLGGHASFIQGKHFTILNPANVKTAVYRIIQHMDCLTKSFFYRVQPLEYGEEITDDHRLKQTFFVDEPSKGEDLTILSFHSASDSVDVYVNMGILLDDAVRISKKPKLIHFSKNYTTTSDPVSNLSTHEYAIGSSESDAERYTEKWFNADMNGRIIIVDPETCEIVKRQVYYDTDQKEWKARIKLTPYKSYFSFDIANKQDNGSSEFSRPLTSLEQGKNYRFGTYSFPVDYMESFGYLEQDNSPEANYHIAGIFFDDNEFHDEASGLEYLKKSAAGGWPAAQVDLAVWYYFNDPQNLQEAADLIKAAVKAGYAPAQFVAAYAFENGIIVDKNLKSAFELYFAAAKDDYAPAILRLSQEDQETQGEDDIRSAFLASAEKDKFYAQYCFGRALLGKIHMEEWLNGLSCLEDRWLGINSAHGFECILSAAEHNCTNAIFDAAYMLDFGEIGIRQDKAQALKWYPKIATDSDAIALRISNWLIDGIGCEAGEEADEEAIRLLFSLIEDGKGPRKAAYKLGWMFFFGRGCDINYEFAKTLFEAAATGSSYYYLGKMYEDGLVGDIDTSLAIEYYKNGAELKDEKCIQRLEELNTSTGQNEVSAFSTEEKIDLIYSVVRETNECTKQIAGNLSSILTFIKDDLSSTLREAKNQLRDNAAVVKSDKLTDETVSTFIEKMSEYINQNTKSSEVLFVEETRHLASLFGQAWKKLLPTSRTSLISAGVLWKSCAEIKDDKDFDFSGICISATAALENELKRYFYTGFQRYLEKIYGSPSDEKWEETFKNWPEAVLSTSKYEYERALKNPTKFKKPILRAGTIFTLGSMPFLLGLWRGKNVSDDQFSLLMDRMDEYLKTIVKDIYQTDARLVFVENGKKDSFVNKCERIRREYRNKAAHVDVVTKIQAEDCYRAVIGKIDAYDHTANITSALLELFSILK